MSKLYVVPTPIGNMTDMTFRAVEVLNSVSLILAEDTRTSSKLMKRYEIQTPMQSHHAFNEHASLSAILKIIASGRMVALITDAGTPAISDPGFLLVRECIAHAIDVECLPGATAFVPAIVNSGLPIDTFAFEGFLPPKKGRQTRLTALAQEHRTMVFYESPHKLLKTLNDFALFFGNDRKISICRELTKHFEETIRGSIDELIRCFQEKQPKGEFVIVVEGKPHKKR